jgi:hypothetical protein
MNNEDLSVISAQVAQKLFNKLFDGKNLDINEVDKKMAYCALVTDFVLETFKQEVEKALEADNESV